MSNKLINTMIATGIATAALTGFAHADGAKEKCYGVAMAGESDCAAGPGSSY